MVFNKISSFSYELPVNQELTFFCSMSPAIQQEKKVMNGLNRSLYSVTLALFLLNKALGFAVTLLIYL